MTRLPYVQAQEAIRAILARIAKHHGVTVDDLLGDRRTRRVAEPWMLAYAVVEVATGMTLSEIGREFGRDHSTILYGIRKARAVHGDLFIDTLGADFRERFEPKPLNMGAAA